MGKLTQKHKIGAFTVVVAACLIVLLWAVSFPVSGEQGGTDEKIETYGEPGGGGDIPWNEVHGFAITEDGTKIEETFNVTLCEEIKTDKDGKFVASGHIFGELHDVYWADENPEPSLEISLEDFDDKKSDEWTLELKLLAEYINEADSPGQEDEERQAWKSVTVTRPNHAPSPVFEITNIDDDDNTDWNWSLVEISDTELIYYIFLDDVDVKFMVNASFSTDDDGDEVTEFRWDLDGDGEFGGESNERKMNTTFFKGEGDHTIGLMVGDGDKYSDPIDLIITIRQPIRYPDLDLFDFDVVNRNGQDEILQGDRLSLDAYVRNSGEEKYEGSFAILYEFWNMDSSPDPSWQEIGILTGEEGLEVNAFKIIQQDFDTNADGIVPGPYAFRATVDIYDSVDELRELNNQREVFNVTITENCDGCDGDTEFEFVSIVIEESPIWKSNVTNIHVTIQNSGEYTAQWVDLKYIVDGMDEIMTTFPVLDPDEEGSFTFVFTESVANTYPIHFVILDNGDIRRTSDQVFVEVIEPPIVIRENVTTNKTADEFPYLIVGAGAILIIVPGVSAIFWTHKKKDDDDVW